MKTKNSHIIYYFSLICVLVIGLFFIINFYPDRKMQMLAVIGMSISYFLIGMIHHLKNHDLVAKIVIEYILIALLGIAVAFFIFKGGFGI